MNRFNLDPTSPDYAEPDDEGWVDDDAEMEVCDYQILSKLV
jgi:hypothetical protein